MTLEEQVRAFVWSLYSPLDVVEIRALRKGDARKQWAPARRMLSIIPELDALSRDGWNIYAGANPRKAEGLSGDLNVSLCRALFADFDHICAGDGLSPGEIVTACIEEAGLPAPTMEIFSGHGVHCYWRLVEPVAPDVWAGLQVRLNQLLRSDPTIKNPERIMRLPGFPNLKDPDNPAECFIIRADKDIRYELSAIESRLPQVEQPKPTAPTVTAARQDGYADRKARAVLYAAKWPTCAEGERNATAFRHSAQMLRDFQLAEADAWEIVTSWNAGNSPPLDERELHQAFGDAAKYGKATPGSKAEPRQTSRQRTATLPVTEPPTEPAAELESLIAAEIDGRFVNIAWPWTHLTELVQALTPQTRTILVGGTGASKSLAILQSVALWVTQGIKVAVLELERSRDFHLKRVLAQRAGIANLTKSEWVRENGELVRNLFATHRDHLNLVGRAIHTAPRQFNVVDAAVWVEKQAEAGCRIIVLDPVTSLMKGQDGWRDDEAFVARIEQTARKSGASLLCVTHPRKGANDFPHLDNLAGGAAWARFPDAVIWLESHDLKVSPVTTCCGTTDMTHNRTIHLLKTRSGEGDHVRLAYQFDVNTDFGALVMRELGPIIKRRRHED